MTRISGSLVENLKWFAYLLLIITVFVGDTWLCLV